MLNVSDLIRNNIQRYLVSGNNLFNFMPTQLMTVYRSYKIVISNTSKPDDVNIFTEIPHP